MKRRGIWSDDRSEFGPRDQFTGPLRGLLRCGSSLAARLSIRWFERRDNQDAGFTSTQLGSRGSGNLLVPAIRDWNGAADRNCEELFHRSVVKCAQRCQLVRGVEWYDC
jgi:hypothetical protein